MKNKLQIYLVTYNRKNKFAYTLETLLSSPIKDFDITILDNASTDGTSELIDEYCNKFPNIKHIRHAVNIGGNANICRAFELSASCGKDYAWILCDDDKYDFSNWGQVEEYIRLDKDIICVSDYVFPSNVDKSDKAYQIFQMTFVPASIFKTKNITNGVLINMYDAVYTMFQQSCLTIHVINNNGSIAVLDKPIVHNGLHFDDSVDSKELSFFRGTDNKKELLHRRMHTIWVLGFCNVISLLQDKTIRYKCMLVSVPYKDIQAKWSKFYRAVYFIYFRFNNLSYFWELFISLPFYKRIEMLFAMISNMIFSITNSGDGKHKVISFLGFKIGIKRKKKTNYSETSE